jgi:hypothetical protein
VAIVMINPKLAMGFVKKISIYGLGSNVSKNKLL